MRSLVALAVVGVAALSLSGCEDKKPTKKADDELTIVVEADRAEKERIAAEKAGLEEKQKGIDEQRERLRQEMEQLDQAKGEKPGEPAASPTPDLTRQLLKLMHDQEEMNAKRTALDKEHDALLQKVMGEPGTKAALANPAPAAPAASPATAELARVTGQVAAREKELASREKSLAEREAALADREKSLAGREAALATRDSACATAAAASAHAGGPGLNRGAIEKAYKGVLALMDAKGILPSDLPPAKQKSLRDAASFQKGDLAIASAAVEQLEAAVNATAVDGPFVSEKAKRVDALQRQSKNAKAKDEVNRLLQEMTRAYSDGRYNEANRALNNIVHLLERQG